MDIQKTKNSFFRIGRKIPSVLYEPIYQGYKSNLVILVMHSDADYQSFSMGDEMAKRGYRVLCANVSSKDNSLDNKISEVAFVMNFIKTSLEAEKIILMGHSGGGTLMSAYESLAENGAEVFQDSNKLVQCSLNTTNFIKADGLMLLDSNWGNGAMRLFSLDPAIISEDSGVKIDPALDLFNAENGFHPEGSSYTDDFLERFFKAQSDRNNRLIDYALERLEIINNGQGNYLDDEPFIIPGAAQVFMNNKIYAQDIRLMSESRGKHILVHADGTTTNEIIHSLRKPTNNKTFTNNYTDGALITTVKNFLNSYAIRTTKDYCYDESSVYGIDWNSSYNCTTGNISNVKIPLLVLGMTAGWEFASAETIYENAKSSDKELAYVEGANHLFHTEHDLETFPGEFGDTLKLTYDYIDKWLEKEGRFF